MNGYATTYAYLIDGEGKVVKINTDTNTVVTTTTLTNTTYVQSGNTSVVGDPVHHYLIVEGGRLVSWIDVYSLPSLTLVKTLDIQTPQPQMFIYPYPDYSKYLIIWWNPKLTNTGAWQFDIYDAASLLRIKTLSTYFLPNNIMFSRDATKLYSIDTGRNKINIYSTSTFTSEGYVDLNPIFNKVQNIGHSINDYRDGKLLIGANIASSFTVTPHLIFYTYDLDAGTTSSILDVGSLRIKCKLSLDVNEYYCDEIQQISTKYGHRYVATGNLYFYNFTNGQLLGVVSLPARFDPSPGIRPQGDYLYYYYYKGPSLIVVEANSYKILKTISIPDGFMGIVFNKE
jgi:hypothetical protein